MRLYWTVLQSSAISSEKNGSKVRKPSRSEQAGSNETNYSPVLNN